MGCQMDTCLDTQSSQKDSLWWPSPRLGRTGEQATRRAGHEELPVRQTVLPGAPVAWVGSMGPRQTGARNTTPSDPVASPCSTRPGKAGCV